MPKTAAWGLLLAAAHDWDEEPPTDTFDQLDALTRDFADRLGFVLDRSTLEGMLFGMAAAIGIATMFEDDPGDESTALALRLARCIVVRRLEALVDQ
jgi:hypothetical protein